MAEKIARGVEALIGETPLLELCRLEKEFDLKARLLAKAECFNPAGSAKDRVAKSMLDDAEARGILTPESVIIEPTSGNTGIGLAAMAAVRGYRAVIVMPDSMSVERQRLMRAYGAEVVLTDGRLGMSGAIAKAEELAAAEPHGWVAGQFSNPANAAAHFVGTGPEIYRDTDGTVDIFLAGVGTGGTVTGVGEYLKSQKPSVRVIGIEPEGSPVLSGSAPGAHGLQGIGAGFVPEVLHREVLDEILRVTEEEAYAAGRALARCEGLLCGVSSGAALSAAIRVAKREENCGKTVVVLLPDTGERYLSTPMFS